MFKAKLSIPTIININTKQTIIIIIIISVYTVYSVGIMK